MRKTMIAGLALASTLGSTAAMAQVDASVGIASEYIFRGAETGSPQVWGGLDWSNDSPFYAGTWISSTGGGDEEVDFYAGADFAIGEGASIDLGAIYYMFPSSDTDGTANATELYAGLNVGDISGYIWYAPAGFEGADDDEYGYAEVNYELGLSENVSLGAHVGYTLLTGSSYDDQDDFMDFGLTLGFGDFFVGVTYLEDNDGSRGFWGTSGEEDDNYSVTVGYSWAFEDVAK